MQAIMAQPARDVNQARPHPPIDPLTSRTAPYTLCSHSLCFRCTLLAHPHILDPNPFATLLRHAPLVTPNVSYPFKSPRRCMDLTDGSHASDRQ
jgi:hypothetical protein